MSTRGNSVACFGFVLHSCVLARLACIITIVRSAERASFKPKRSACSVPSGSLVFLKDATDAAGRRGWITIPRKLSLLLQCNGFECAFLCACVCVCVCVCVRAQWDRSTTHNALSLGSHLCLQLVLWCVETALSCAPSRFVRVRAGLSARVFVWMRHCAPLVADLRNRGASVSVSEAAAATGIPTSSQSSASPRSTATETK